MFEIAKLLDDRFSLNIIALSNQREFLDEFKKEALAHKNIKILPPVKMEEIVSFTNCFDVGIYSLPPTSFNNKFALPNKFFEFIAARLALVFGAMIETTPIIKEGKIGVVAKGFDAKSMASAINDLDRESIMKFKNNSHILHKKLCMERNAKILLGIVDELLKLGEECDMA